MYKLEKKDTKQSGENFLLLFILSQLLIQLYLVGQQYFSTYDRMLKKFFFLILIILLMVFVTPDEISLLLFI